MTNYKGGLASEGVPKATTHVEGYSGEQRDCEPEQSNDQWAPAAYTGEIIDEGVVVHVLYVFV